MPNPWSNPDQLPLEERRNLAVFIESRAHLPDQRLAHDALLDTLAPQKGERLVDVGCGTGVITRVLAERVGAQGHVIGVDISQAMIDHARTLAISDTLRYECADCSALPFADNSFDAASAVRVVMHAADPYAVLRETRRVLRLGGRLALLERDWGTAAVDLSDRALTRRILDWRTDTIDGNNWMGRQLVRHCLETGWQIADVRAFVSIARDASGTTFGSLRRCADLALQNQIITQSEHAAWTGELDQRLAQGLFFASMNEYIVVACKV